MSCVTYLKSHSQNKLGDAQQNRLVTVRSLGLLASVDTRRSQLAPVNPFPLPARCLADLTESHLERRPSQVHRKLLAMQLHLVDVDPLHSGKPSQVSCP